MFFQEATPDTSGYMIAGYAVAFIVMALYVASIYLRSRNLQRDITTLHELEESSPTVQTRAANPTRQTPPLQGYEKNEPAQPVTKRTRKKQA